MKLSEVKKRLIPYRRYSGAGNLFALIDGQTTAIPYASLTVPLCQKAAVDGMIALEKSAIADFRMRIFNRDGSEAEMCGNGLRCLIRFIEDSGWKWPTYRIETAAGIHTASSTEEAIVTSFPSRKIHLRSTTLTIHNQNVLIYFLNTGVPHAVLFVSELEKIDPQSLGSAIRHHPFFAPQGTNVTFVTKKEGHSLAIRTYERGVEAETGACGTGAAAAALTTAALFATPSPIKVYVRSGDTLTIQFSPNWEQLSIKGPALFLDEDTIDASRP